MVEVLHAPRPSGILPSIVLAAHRIGIPPWRTARLNDVRPLESGDTDLWFAAFDAIIDAAVIADSSVLDAAERVRAAAIGDSTARARFVAARLLLRALLARYSNVPPVAVHIEMGAHGKPLLRAPSALQFNVSHSGNGLLIAIAAAVTVGVDYEAPRRLTDPQRLAQRVFSAAELAALQSAAAESEAAHHALFMRLWTRKEALLKALGSGFAGGFKDYDVRADSVGGHILYSFDTPAPGTAALAQVLAGRVRSAFVWS